jgi:hypothetical protein
MKPSRGFWVALAGAAAAFGLIFGLFLWLSPCNAFKQQANMRAAEEFIQTVQPRLVLEPRFSAVTLISYTGGKCGCLLVNGSVASDDDLAALKAFIDQGSPSMEVKYSVTVGE